MKNLENYKHCDSYDEKEEITGWITPSKPITRTVGRCRGTKECDTCSCEGNQFNCDFYEHVREGAKNNKLKDMKQYHFEREQFEKVWEEVFTKEELPIVLSEGNVVTAHFLYTRIGDEHYLIHLDSGTLINWYKHLGRTNTCNNEKFTLSDLYTMIQLYAKDYREEVLSLRKEKQQVSKTNEPDISSVYPKTILNSFYGITKIHKALQEYAYYFIYEDNKYKVYACSKKEAINSFNKTYGIPHWFIKKYFKIIKEKQ